MYLTDIILKMPCWYLWVLIVFSLYYAIRGVLEQTIIADYDRLDSRLKRIIYHYIQEILFKIIVTASGFIALLIVNYIFSTVKSFSDISIGTAILLSFLIFWGVTGVTGYLTLYIVRSKVPLVSVK